MEIIELRGVTVATHVDVEISSVRQFKVEKDGETTKIYIKGGREALNTVWKVNRLVGETVDLVVSAIQWELGGRSGIKNFLRQIERST